MKAIIGLAMIVGGIVLGLYVGVWVCFIGGIVDIIQEIRAEQLEVMGVAFGILKIICAGIAGWASAVVLAIPGGIILKSA